ncbi:MAG TPA: hypothetical protein VNJ07_01285 [Chitinophagales bacterium]|nr:hypothetical protein [Chitinophagales bacterium]
MSEDDSIAIDALILYPKVTRDAMLEVALYPEALVKLHSLRTESSKAFTNLMSSLSKEEQEKFWDLVRYKGLVQRLAEGNKKSENEIRDILKNYPGEIHETAIDLGTRHYETLVKINEQEKSFQQHFQNLLKSYPPVTQQALTALLDLPEVLDILQDNISLVVLVGDAYRKNPDFIKHKADSLSLETARQNAEDIKQWSKTLEENPEAAEELKQSAKQYAKEYGYDEDAYAKPEDTGIVVIHHYYEPYPYWFGWPWWYPPHWWYPYPFWYHWGFYFSDGGIIVFSLPSYFFVSWYFYYPIHHYYYPHLSDAYIHTYHYYGPRRVSNSITRAVDDWKKEKGDDLPPDLLNEDAQRVARLKEYGKFEEDYVRHNSENPGKPLSRQDFFQKNEKKYPNLNYPRRKIRAIQQDDDVYRKERYPTKKKEIENKSYERKWAYPEKREPIRQFYPDKQATPQKKAEPQRKVYPQNNVQPQKKFIPQKQMVPQKQIPQKNVQSKSNKIVKQKTDGRQLKKR